MGFKEIRTGDPLLPLSVRPYNVHHFKQWSAMRTEIGHNQSLKLYRKRANADQLQKEFGQRLMNRDFGCEPLFLAVTSEYGIVGELIVNPAQNWTVYLSWIKNPLHGGKGYMTSATEALVDYLFAVGTHRVVAVIEPENEKSRALAQRVGFRHESTAVNVQTRENRWVDLEYWALLFEDREKASKA